MNDPLARQPDVPVDVDGSNPGRRKAIAIAVAATLIAGGFALGFAKSGGKFGPVQMALMSAIVVAVIAGVTAIAVYSRRAENKRRERVSGELVNEGFEVNVKGDSVAREKAFAGLGHLKQLRAGAKGVQWSSEGVIDDVAVRLFEHQYIVSTGKSHHTVRNTVAVCPCPAVWPVLSLSPENVLHRMADWLGMRDIRVESEAFNKRWRVKCDNEQFAITLLGPELQEWLSSTPGNETWVIGEGCLCRMRQARVEPEQLGAFARGVIEFRGLIAPELDAWDGRG